MKATRKATNRQLLSPCVLLALLCWCVTPRAGSAQQAPADTTEALRVFLDCSRCDLDYFRSELPFLNYVRNRDEAQVHVLVTDQRTGSGGRQYQLEFIGLRRFAPQTFQLLYATSSDATYEEERSGLAGRLLTGLMPYLLGTPAAARLQVTYEAPEAGTAGTQPDDPWNSWVFDVDLGGNFDLEASARDFELQGGFSADRVTEDWRIRTNARFDYDFERFEQGDRVINSRRSYRRFRGDAVKSLGDHWSAGVEAEAFATTFNNISLGLDGEAAVEYSLFPYREVHQREVTLAYSIGPQYRQYYDETIYGKTSETLLQHELEGRLQYTRPWGSAFARLEGSHFFHDPGKFRIDFYSTVSVRLYRGLSLRVFLGADWIRDQLFLPKGDATLEEILLRQRQLRTTYQFQGGVGISYTFGSIYNNVVNTRL